MSEVNFTLDDVVAKVREVAAERPDYVYEAMEDVVRGTTTCLYRHGENREEPGCIVGQALDRLGYVVPAEFEGDNAAYLLGKLFDAERNVQISWVWNVQSRQDSGKSWGWAVENADSYARLGVA